MKVVILDGEADANKQVSQVENFIAQGGGRNHPRPDRLRRVCAGRCGGRKGKDTDRHPHHASGRPGPGHGVGRFRPQGLGHYRGHDDGQDMGARGRSSLSRESPVSMPRSSARWATRKSWPEPWHQDPRHPAGLLGSGQGAEARGELAAGGQGLHGGAFPERQHGNGRAEGDRGCREVEQDLGVRHRRATWIASSR